MDSKYEHFENKNTYRQHTKIMDYDNNISNTNMVFGDINFRECKGDMESPPQGIRKGGDQIYLDRCLSTKKGMETCPVRYSFAVAILWSIFLGLASGFLLAILESNGGQQYKAEFVLTLLHFLICFCLICQPANLALVRVWLITGLVWISGMAVSYYTTHWMEQNEDWWRALMVGSIAWISTVGLPLSILFVLPSCL